MKIPIALQLYSVRNDCQHDLWGVLRRVADMGYDGVEFAGYYGHEPADIKKELDRLGLRVEGTHTQFAEFADDRLAATVDLHKTLDCRYAIIPWIPEELRSTPEACKSTAERLTKVAEKLRPHGIQTGFHAHDGDMRQLEGGKSSWDLLATGTPDDFIMQYDTANGMAGGADPVQPIRDVPGRALSVHLKGYNGGHGALVGDPGIPWDKVFEACETVGGTKWYVVEHETESQLSPLDAVDRCLQNLRAMGK